MDWTFEHVDAIDVDQTEPIWGVSYVKVGCTEILEWKINAQILLITLMPLGDLEIVKHDAKMSYVSLLKLSPVWWGPVECSRSCIGMYLGDICVKMYKPI